MDNQSNDVDGTVLMIRLEIQDGAGPVPVLAEPQICLSPLCPCTEMRLQIRPASLDAVSYTHLTRVKGMASEGRAVRRMRRGVRIV